MAEISVSLEIRHGNDFGDEIELNVEFHFTNYGCPAHMGSLNYSGHPAESSEIEIDKIFWPIQRWDAEAKILVPDHVELPDGWLSQSLEEGLNNYILEHYDPELEYYD